MSIKISLNKNIYPEWAVAHASVEYRTLAVIDVTKDCEYLVCSFHNCRYDEELTTKEFLNYLVNLLNSTGNL